MAKVRRQAVELIIGNDDRELAGFVASFDRDAKALVQSAPAQGCAQAPGQSAPAHGAAESLAASSAMGTAVAMTKAPPCQNYKDLVVLTSLEETLTSLDSCTDVASIKDIQNMFTVKRTPFASLLTACKSAVVELRSAMKSSSGPKVDNAGKKTALFGNIFEVGPQVGTEIPTYTHDAAGQNIDVSTPFIQQCDPEKHKELVETPAVQEHLQEFTKVFRASEKAIRKSQGGRTQCKAPAPVRESSMKLITEAVGAAGFVFEEAGLKSDGKASVQEGLVSHTYGIASSCDSHGTERGFTPCMRLAVEGARKVVMIAVSDLAAFMISEGQAAESAFNVQNMKDFFANLTLEQGTKLIQLKHQVSGCQMEP